jgi:hypothetical protein
MSKIYAFAKSEELDLKVFAHNPVMELNVYPNKYSCPGETPTARGQEKCGDYPNDDIYSTLQIYPF